MLNIVATPIGNLEDMTYRAVRILQESEIILCEDTRHSRTLLDRYDIKAKLVSYHKFNENERVEYVLAKLHEGVNISLISDAGTPIISDPGYILVDRVKRAGLPYTSIPGASAVVNALVLSGKDSSSFTFFGFLPKSKKRKDLIKKAESITNTVIFYISPHSINEDLADLYKGFGARSGVILKEMTKFYEKAIDITLADDLKLEIKGEMVLVLEGKTEVETNFMELSPMEHLMGYINSGMPKNEAIKKVAKERGVLKNEIYTLLI